MKPVLVLGHGAIPFVARQVRAIADAGVPVVWLSEAAPACPVGRGLEWRPFAPSRAKTVGPLYDLLRMPAYVRGAGAGLVHAYFVERYGWWAARAGVHPFVLSPLGSDIAAPRNGVYRALTADALGAADAVVCDGPALAARVAGAWGVHPGRVHTIGFGLDAERFRPPTADERAAARAAWGVDPAARVLLAHRRAEPLYRPFDVLDAFAGIAASHADAVLLIGAGGALGPAVRARAAALNATLGAVRVTPVPFVPAERVVELLWAADVVVSVPERDNAPNTLLEALACDRTLIVSAVPGIEHTAPPTPHRFLVPPGNVPALTAAMRAALAAPPPAGAHRALTAQRRTTEAEAARLVALYERLMQRT